MPSTSTISSLTGTKDASAPRIASRWKTGRSGTGIPGAHNQVSERLRGAWKVSVFSLTPHVESVRQRIKAGKQRTKFTLAGTLWEIPMGMQVGGRDLERLFLCASAGLCASLQRAAGSSLWQTAAARDKEASGQTKLRQALGRQIHIHIAPLMAETREFNSSSYLHSWISDSGH